MIYQFIDWRIGLHRRMSVVQVETLFERLRADNGGTLPLYLRRWEQRLIFAGEAGIALPEMRTVAEAMTANDSYPTMSWLDDQYITMLRYIGVNAPDLLTDPPVVKTPPKLEGLDPAGTPPVPQPGPVPFETIVAGSISNTEGKGDACSAPVPATSTPGSTSTGLPNSSLTEKKPSPPRPPR